MSASQKTDQEQVKLFFTGDTIPYNMVLPDAQGNPFSLVSLMGRPVIVFYLLQLSDEKCLALLKWFISHAKALSDKGFQVVGVSPDNIQTIAQAIQSEKIPFPFLSDEGVLAGRDLGLASWENLGEIDRISVQRTVMVLDGTLRARHIETINDIAPQMSKIVKHLETLVAVREQAPVLQIPLAFEKRLCQNLIDIWQTSMNGQGDTIPQETKDAIMQAVDLRLGQRVSKRLKRAFRYQPQYREPPRIWRHEDLPLDKYIQCNESEHTAYREFAIMIPLNRAAAEGAEVEFMEYGPTCYAPDDGEALVFSCDLLMRFRPATKGNPLWYTTFFYTDAQDFSDRKGDKPISDNIF